jgi:hypothetical protein
MSTKPSFAIHTSHHLNPYPVIVSAKTKEKKSVATTDEKKEESTKKILSSNPLRLGGSLVVHPTGEISDYH